MTARHTFRVVFRPAARLSWLQRGIGLLLLATIAVIGFFFLTVALVAGGVLAVVILLRLWWLKRRLGASTGTQSMQSTQTYEGDYVVIEHANQAPRSPNGSGRPA